MPAAAKLLAEHPDPTKAALSPALHVGQPLQRWPGRCPGAQRGGQGGHERSDGRPQLVAQVAQRIDQGSAAAERRYTDWWVPWDSSAT